MALPSPAFVSDQKPRDDNPTQQASKPAVQQANNNFNQNRQKSFDCRVCSIKYDTQNELFQHRKNHETCAFDGCKFNALEAVVTAHYQRAHVGNSSMKVQDLSTPEEIEKWREERRRRYPTVANVTLKQQISAEKNQRGERIQKSDRKFSDFKQKKFIESNGRDQHQNHNKRNHRQNQNHKKSFNRNQPYAKNPHQNHHQQSNEPPKVANIKTSPAVDAVEKSRKTPAFGGMAVEKQQQESPAEPKNSLSLLGQYSSSDEASDGEVIEEPTSLPINNETVEPEPDVSKVDSEPEEVPIDRKVEIQPSQPEKINKQPRKHPPKDFNRAKRKLDRNQPLLDYSKLRRTSANPFLEKLLQDDIQHERNVILQCINFIVKSDFLGIEKSTVVQPPQSGADESNNKTE